MRQWAEARESSETEEETDAQMPALPAEMRAKYARWWDVLRHPPSEWWEVTEGVWRRRRAVVQAELEETTPVRRRSRVQTTRLIAVRARECDGARSKNQR